MSRSIVITGSTRGLGLAMAQEFIKADCQVLVSGRKAADVEQVVLSLSSLTTEAQVHGLACDVREFNQVQALWDEAIRIFGEVDIWINNAGIAHPQMAINDLEPELIEQVLNTNLVGVLNGARVASAGMLEQGSGAIYNMEGLGSDGRHVEGLALYGSTKYALSYLTDAMIQEFRTSPIQIGGLRPGMVITDLITIQYEGRPDEWERAKRIFNIFADLPETVVPWMVNKILLNYRHGRRITWLSTAKIIWRLLTSRILRRDIFPEGIGR